MARESESTAETGTNEPDGQFDDQNMPTTDGQMASNTSEEVVPPRAKPGA
jgi:hypothetical protein